MAGADGDRKTERLDCLCRSLLLFDLARLKTINETLGFATGDTLIKEVASRAQAVLKAVSQSQAAGLTDFQGSKTLLTHINGGRFAIVSELNERVAIEHLQRLLTEAMVQPVQCADRIWRRPIRRVT